MKKFLIMLPALGMLYSSAAAVEGVGYDVGLEQIKLRIGLGAVKLEPGIGFAFNDGAPGEDEFGMGVSVMVLFPIWEYEKLTTHIMGGVNIQELQAPANPDEDVGITFFGGLQPELDIWDHLIVSTRFGLNVPMVPDLMVGTYGDGLFDLTAGMTFMIKFGGSSGSSDSSYTPSTDSDY